MNDAGHMFATLSSDQWKYQRKRAWDEHMINYPWDSPDITTPHLTSLLRNENSVIANRGCPLMLLLLLLLLFNVGGLGPRGK